MTAIGDLAAMADNRSVIRITNIRLLIDHGEDALRSAIAQKLRIDPQAIRQITIFKRSQDVRQRHRVWLIYSVDVETDQDEALLDTFADDQQVKETPDMAYRFVAKADPILEKRPLIIGSGPCGIFAALALAQMGFRPLILERGQPVRQRTKDTFAFWRKGELNPESNVQFGEGGAGTFSDGKLYSQIRDPHFIGRKVLQEFVNHGADPEILYVNKPHIGTLRLVRIVETMRERIIELGGEYRFGSKMETLLVDEGQVRGVVLADGETIESDHVILAVGHSARDTFAMLHEQGVYIEAKPFSIGYRIEHPQSMIDQVRFGENAGHAILGAADYKLVHHCKNGRSVYSFCMCPGGVVVAAASETGGVVTNGMSYYSRVERNANAGIVVGLTPEEDYPNGPLAGIALQRELEQRAFQLGGANYNAPAQLVGDFLAGRSSPALAEVIPSIQPGVELCDLGELLPDFAVTAIREALVAFGRKLRGFDRPDAILTGVETRTSSPIRIKRDESLQSLNTKGLYPAGEGAGYAGGIFSAGVDGIKVAQAVALSMNQA